jgi:hypothetical protein
MDRLVRNIDLKTAGSASDSRLCLHPDRDQAWYPPSRQRAPRWLRHVNVRDAVIIGSVTAALACCLVSLTYAKGDDQLATAAKQGHPLTAKELNSMYEGHTWRWKDGAAYFDSKDKGFKAWVGDGAEASYADGSWSANDQGRLCFRATWYVTRGHERSTTCLELRADDKNIYQRKLPRGDWYVFSHLPALPDDEIQKLQSGDNVSESYLKNKRYVTAHAGAGTHNRKKRRR